MLFWFELLFMCACGCLVLGVASVLCLLRLLVCLVCVWRLSWLVCFRLVACGVIALRFGFKVWFVDLLLLVWGAYGFC